VSSETALVDATIVGAGPVGLAAAIEARRIGLTYALLEKGALTQAITEYPTGMVFFTTAELLEIGGYPFTIAQVKPNRQEALAYYRKVAEAEGLVVRQRHEVREVRREGDRFVVTGVARRGLEATRCAHVANLESVPEAGGAPFEVRSRGVAIATGYFSNPVLMGVPGESLAQHYYTEAHPYWNRDVVVIGGGNSAAEAALDLYRHGARVTLVVRGEAMKPTVKYWVKPDVENRIKEGAIRARFATRVSEIKPDGVVIVGLDGQEFLRAEVVFALTGFRPDVGLLERAGVAIREDLTAQLDPDTCETNVPGLYALGSAAAGVHTGKVFIENGRVHAVRAMRHLARRLGRLSPDGDASEAPRPLAGELGD
jgi:thioredoxin reductase (NADPH)